MNDINSASDYYQYKAESDAKIKSMTDEIVRLNSEITSSKLESQIDKYVTRNGGNEDVSKLIFNQLKGSDIDTQSLPEFIDSIRSNENLQRFFSKAGIPAPAPQREYKQWWD